MADLFQIVIILLASLVASLIFRRLHLPVVVGQILVGLVLAPSLLGWIHGSHTLAVMSEMGVILLMFLAGLESDLSVLRKHLKASLLVAVSGILVPLLIFGLVTGWLGFGNWTAVFYGIVFAATSVSITVEVLQEYGRLSSRAGHIILGAAVVDDILAVLALSVFTSVHTGSGDLILQFGQEALFIFGLVLVHWAVPRIWHLVDRLPIYARHTTVSLILCLSLALVADAVGMSAVIGAFFAGLAISQTEVSQQIEKSISLIAYVVFIPIFFVFIAVSVKFDALWKHPLLIGLLTGLAILTKFLPAYLSARATGLSSEEGTLIGAGMVSRGEMALVVVQIGLASRLIDQGAYSDLVIVIILTTIAAPFLMKWGMKKR